MRLQEIFSICNDAQCSWVELAFEEKRTPGGTLYYNLVNTSKVKQLLADLKPVAALSEHVAVIQRTSVALVDDQGTAHFNSTSRNTVETAYAKLETKVKTIAELSHSLNYDQRPDGFDIKLPPDISLQELSKCTRDLNTIFSSCPGLADNEGTIKFSAVDVGSVWLSFAIVGASIGILNMLAALVDKALIIRSHHLTLKEQSERVRSLGLANDLMEGMVKTYQAMEEKMLEQATADLAKEHGVTDQEGIQNLQNSIQILTGWMDKGMEIHAAIQSAPEVKAVFPPVEKQALPEGVLAMLTDKTEENEH